MKQVFFVVFMTASALAELPPNPFAVNPRLRENQKIQSGYEMVGITKPFSLADPRPTPTPVPVNPRWIKT